MNENEIWVEVRNLDCAKPYEVSNFGRIRNAATGHVLSAKSNNSHRQMQVRLDTYPFGYCQYTLSRIVYGAFHNDNNLGNTRVGHLDGDPTNNRLDNLYLY